MSEKKGYAKGFLLGILAGGATGGLLALLFAPKSGKEMRKDIVNKKNELVEDVEKYAENAKVKANDFFNDGKKKAGEFVEDAKRKAGEISKGAGELYNSGMEKISNIKDAFKSGVNAYDEEMEHSESGNKSNNKWS